MGPPKCRFKALVAAVRRVSIPGDFRRILSGTQVSLKP